ncbi:uncharacterized protein Tco025E_07430 [Trypanosoma conorhini]|uniref:Uncharacterized protein n=1 Tax=Trypanosoma conorhini TaxID=83891 RepID=A0A3R7M173_9TRYP|nr:uncharacterized protein Tco025E_07430 [Trypanosoma conorhini]RNF07163.1 hypothetical protein Tco025E_07430 [Trypanosoma conorhini]
MLQSLLHHSQQGEADGESAAPPLLRSLLRPASHCPLFDVTMEKEHAWPCANLLSGSARYRAQYEDGAHLVMSDNRLLVVRQGEHFYCPPWDSPIHDACIRQQGADGDAVLAVGLADGVYVAQLRAAPQLQVADDVFVGTKHAVEKIVFARDGELALCHGNAHVATYQLVTGGQQKLGLLPVGGRHPLNFLHTLASLWDTRRYRDSAYDASRGRLFVLSNAELTVWGRASTSAFAAECCVQLQGSAVAVLPSSPLHRYATLVFSNGGRQPVLFEETPAKRSDEARRTVLRLGAVRPLPEDVRVDSVELASQDAEGTTVLYDARTCTALLLAAASPIYEEIYDVVEVVSVLRLSTSAVGVACISEPADPAAAFIVYGKAGILCHIGVRSLGCMFAEIVRQPGPSDGPRASLQRLGPKRGIGALVGAAFAGAATEALSPLLTDLLQPAFRGSEMRVAPGVHGIVALVHRAMALAESLWRAPLSWHQACGLERMATHLWAWHEKLEALLRPSGYLDCPKPLELSWSGFTATAPHPFTLRTALNAQAMLLARLLRGLQDAGVLCWLYSLRLRGSLGTAVAGRSRLDRVVWGDDPATAVTSLCLEILATEDRFAMAQLEARRGLLPPRARHAVSVAVCIAANQPDAALAYACDNVRSLRQEQVFDYVAEKLEGAFPDSMPHLRLLLCCLRHSRGAVADVLGMLERYSQSESAEQLKRRLDVVLQAAAEHPALQHAVLRWIFSHPLEDDRVMGFAEALEQHAVAIAEPHTLTALFCDCWLNRTRRPAAAARGFCDIARGQQRLGLASRILCVKLALEAAPTTSGQLVYFVLLLQEELADAIAAAAAAAAPLEAWQQAKAEADVDELRHTYLEERRLFQLAGEYQRQGGAKVQLDLLKVHPETPEGVTVEVVQGLLEFLLATGLRATEAVRNVVREYYDGYAAGLPLLPFVALLAQHGESAAQIAALLHSSGVPPAAVFDVFLHFLDERDEGAGLGAGAVATTLAATVAQLSGESRELCAAYLLERIRGLLAGEHAAAAPTGTALQTGEIAQLQRAEASLRRPRTVSPV